MFQEEVRNLTGDRFNDSWILVSSDHRSPLGFFFLGGVGGCVKHRHTQIPTGSIMHLRIESRCIVVSLQSHCDFLGPRKLYSAERRWTQLDVFSPSMARVAHQDQFGRSKKRNRRRSNRLLSQRIFTTNQLSKVL